jgi:hypothetical protein
MEGRLESAEQRRERELRALAERAVQLLVDALALAGLPPLPSLEAGRVTLCGGGVHIEVGGCNPRTLEAIAAYIAAHARCLDRVVRSAAMPAGLAELPAVRGEVRNSEEA